MVLANSPLASQIVTLLAGSTGIQGLLINNETKASAQSKKAQYAFSILSLVTIVIVLVTVAIVKLTKHDDDKAGYIIGATALFHGFFVFASFITACVIIHECLST
jgi:hypothetical protein